MSSTSRTLFGSGSTSARHTGSGRVPAFSSGRGPHGALLAIVLLAGCGVTPVVPTAHEPAARIFPFSYARGRTNLASLETVREEVRPGDTAVVLARRARGETRIPDAIPLHITLMNGEADPAAGVVHIGTPLRPHVMAIRWKDLTVQQLGVVIRRMGGFCLIALVPEVSASSASALERLVGELEDEGLEIEGRDSTSGTLVARIPRTVERLATIRELPGVGAVEGVLATEVGGADPPRRFDWVALAIPRDGSWIRHGLGQTVFISYLDRDGDGWSARIAVR